MPTPVEYAEENLGVHAVWDDLMVSMDLYEIAVEAVQQWNLTVHEKRQALDNAEIAVIMDAQAQQFPSDNARSVWIKNQTRADDRCIKARKELASAELALQNAELDERRLRVKAEAIGTRQQVLGGLLHFYAAAKAQQTARMSATS